MKEQESICEYLNDVRIDECYKAIGSMEIPFLDVMQERNNDVDMMENINDFLYRDKLGVICKFNVIAYFSRGYYTELTSDRMVTFRKYHNNRLIMDDHHYVGIEVILYSPRIHVPEKKLMKPEDLIIVYPLKRCLDNCVQGENAIFALRDRCKMHKPEYWFNKFQKEFFEGMWLR